MKPSNFPFVFALCILMSAFSGTGRAVTPPPQAKKVPKPELQKLEEVLDRADELDKRSPPVKVEIEGDKEPTAKIKISMERRETVQSTANVPPKEGPPKKVFETVSIDLSLIDISDEYIAKKLAGSKFATSEKCGSIDSVSIRQIGVTAYYSVIEDYTYRTSAGNNLIVLQGFRYDRASIPRVLWVILDKDALGNVAPLIHDLLYRHHGVLPEGQVSPYRKFSRKEADLLFYEIMEKCGVSYTRRVAAYEAVRKFAFWAWKDE